MIHDSEKMALLGWFRAITMHLSNEELRDNGVDLELALSALVKLLEHVS